MGRPLWFFAGAGAGVYAALRARRAADALTADGLRDRVQALRVGARLFREEVEQGRVEAETGLRQRLGLVPHGTPELEAPRHRAPAAHDSPTPHPDAHDLQEGSSG
jgi:hypothetical protein